MGLDFVCEPGYDEDGYDPVCGEQHDYVQFSYAGFSHFRNQLAKAAGIGTKMDQEGLHEIPDLPMNSYPLDNFYGEWEQDPDDPLLALLVHSDCDGMLPARLCGLVADRVEELAEDAFEDSPYRYDDHARRFVDDLRHCAESDHDLMFC